MCALSIPSSCTVHPIFPSIVSWFILYHPPPFQRFQWIRVISVDVCVCDLPPSFCVSSHNTHSPDNRVTTRSLFRHEGEMERVKTSVQTWENERNVTWQWEKEDKDWQNTGRLDLFSLPSTEPFAPASQALFRRKELSLVWFIFFLISSFYLLMSFMSCSHSPFHWQLLTRDVQLRRSWKSNQRTHHYSPACPQVHVVWMWVARSVTLRRLE